LINKVKLNHELNKNDSRNNNDSKNNNNLDIHPIKRKYPPFNSWIYYEVSNTQIKIDFYYILVFIITFLVFSIIIKMIDKIY
jgi:hypothetical protein